jgi:hypothetical protein
LLPALKLLSCLAYSSDPQDGGDMFLRNAGWLSDLHDWRFTANQFVLSTIPLRLKTCGQCPYGTFSPTRGWVCRLELLLALASAVILRSESHGTHDTLLSHIRDPHNMEGQVPIFISPRNMVPQLYGLHSVIYHKIEFVTTAVRTSDPTYMISVFKRIKYHL